MVMKKLLVLATIVALSVSAFAAANLQITEIYSGLSGDDGTADWFEITNYGDSAWDLTASGLYYDDDSQAWSKADPITGITSIAAGESVIVMVSGSASDIDTMRDLWNLSASIQVGIVDGAGIGNDATDGATLFDSLQTILDYAEYDWPTDGLLCRTIDFTVDPAAPTTPGVNGAYHSDMFYNSVYGCDICLVGTPGFVPEPATMALLGLGALVLRRRK